MGLEYPCQMPWKSSHNKSLVIIIIPNFIHNYKPNLIETIQRT